jgi:photosystem II stability/assembly factor-like uncharacterized protein
MFLLLKILLFSSCCMIISAWSSENLRGSSALAMSSSGQYAYSGRWLWNGVVDGQGVFPILMVSENYGFTWEYRGILPPLPLHLDFTVYHVACDSTGQIALAVVGAEQHDSLCRTLDFGKTWAVVFTDEYFYGIYGLAMNSNGQYIYSSINMGNGFRILSSSDFGNTWLIKDYNARSPTAIDTTGQFVSFGFDAFCSYYNSNSWGENYHRVQFSYDPYPGYEIYIPAEAYQGLCRYVYDNTQEPLYTFTQDLSRAVVAVTSISGTTIWSLDTHYFVWNKIGGYVSQNSGFHAIACSQDCQHIFLGAWCYSDDKAVMGIIVSHDYGATFTETYSECQLFTEIKSDDSGQHVIATAPQYFGMGFPALVSSDYGKTWVRISYDPTYSPTTFPTEIPSQLPSPAPSVTPTAVPSTSRPTLALLRFQPVLPRLNPLFHRPFLGLSLQLSNPQLCRLYFCRQ